MNLKPTWMGACSNAALAVCAVAAAPAHADAENTISTGIAVHSHEFRVERPTLENLGFEWDVAGDSNRNAKVSVDYRRVGEAEWRQGMPLLRLKGEEVISRQFAPGFTYVSPNMFAGSIFDLQPGTEYEARFTLTDPDGVMGQSTVTTRVKTRAEPKPAQGGMVYHVYPYEYKGPRQSPSFDGLLAAYYKGALGGDWYNAAPVRVKPGDVVLVHAGVYKDQRYRYGHELVPSPVAGRPAVFKECCGTTGFGTYFLTADGTPDKPIVIKAAGDGEVIFDGDGNFNLFNVMGADYNYFEGITFRNTEVAILAGYKDIAGAKGLTVRRSRFVDVGLGIHTDFAGSADFYIADNDFIGRQSATYMTGWGGEWAALPGWRDNSDALSQYAVKIYGPGNVVAYNRIRNFHDGIDHATYGDPDQYPRTPFELRPASIDIYNNDISNVHDNCVEADGATQNIRVMRNLCVNSAYFALSMQPVLGGPAYFIRNIVYNSPFYGVAKMSEYPAGGIYINNTFFSNFAPGFDKAGSNIHLLNNIIINQNRTKTTFQVATFTNYSSSDYNGFGGPSTAMPFEWNAPAAGIAVDTQAPLQRKSYPSLKAYSDATGHDRHSIAVSLGDFQNVPAIPADASPNTVYDGSRLDPTPRRGTAPIDRGTIVPNVTDGFAGKAPDLGAIELGRPAPHYGPRDARK